MTRAASIVTLTLCAILVPLLDGEHTVIFKIAQLFGNPDPKMSILGFPDSHTCGKLLVIACAMTIKQI